MDRSRTNDESNGFGEIDDIYESYVSMRRKQLLDVPSSISEIHDEPELIRRSKTERMIVHFYDPRFRRCGIMDSALKAVEPMFPGVRFRKTLASKCDLVAKRLGIRALPFLAFFKDGYFIDRLVGFDGLSGDDFDPDELADVIRGSEIWK